MAGDDARYESKSVTALRFTEDKTIAEMQADGWELVGQNQRLLRTQLEFRRAIPNKQRWPWALWALAMLCVVIAITIGVVHERSIRNTPEAAPPPAVTSPAPTPAATSPSPAPSKTTRPEDDPEPEDEWADEGQDEPDPVLWKKSDGKQKIGCTARDGRTGVTFTLPAASPITKELNSILHEFDGRKPVTVLTVTQAFWRVGGDETSSLFRGLVLQTPDGPVEVNEENSVEEVLTDTKLVYEHAEVGTKKLKARVAALEDLMSGDSDYYVLKKPLTQVNSAQGDFWEDSLVGCWVG